MRDLIVVIVLLIAGVAEGFRRCFPEWINASKVSVICQDRVKKNETLLAQCCGPYENCQTTNKPGVLLEKASICLTVTNSSYDSWPCEIKAFVNDTKQGPERFIINVRNQSTSTSPNPEAPSTSPNPGHNESQSGPIAAGVSVPIICLLIIGLLIIGLLIIYFILYKKVKRFRKVICGFFSRLQRNKKNPNQEPDIEKGEKENFLSSG
ncbi:uncharacterized protein [Chanodichthys erythropterus]|uniref:uncharacterized protein n=1 Tax=Chanodichthys erythropterus TaxID=933992 RepID=UPI00351F47EA